MRNNDNSNNLQDLELPTATEAFEQTKEPQLRMCINQIVEATKCGKMQTNITDNEKLHDETLQYLLNKGYDVHVTCFKKAQNLFFPREFDAYFNTIFWGEGASGNYEYEEK